MANTTGSKWLAGKGYKDCGDSPRKVRATATEDGRLWVFETAENALTHKEPTNGMVYTTDQGFVLTEDVVPYTGYACLYSRLRAMFGCGACFCQVASVLRQ